MPIKLFVRSLLMICSLAILGGIWSGIANADEPVTSQANFRVFLPMITKPASNCQISNLLQNGSFESGAASWSQNSSGGYQIIAHDNDAYHGSWSAWLGGYNNANDRLSQTLNIPAACKALKIVVYVDVYSTDSPFFAFDKLYGSLQPVNSVSNPEPLIATNKDHTDTVHWRRMTYVYNQIPNPGQPLRLYLHGITDSSNYTNFFVDLVSIQASDQSFPLLATTIQTADGGVIGWEVEDIPGQPMDDLSLNPPAGWRVNSR